MSALKDLFHSITPAERKRIDKDNEDRLQAMKASHDKIYNSPVSAKIFAEIASSLEFYSHNYANRSEYKNPIISVGYTRVIILNTLAICNTQEIHKRLYFSELGHTDLTEEFDRKYLAEYLLERLTAEATEYCTCYKSMPSVYKNPYQTNSMLCNEYFFQVYVKDLTISKTPSTPPLKSW